MFRLDAGLSCRDLRADRPFAFADERGASAFVGCDVGPWNADGAWKMDRKVARRSTDARLDGLAMKPRGTAERGYGPQTFRAAWILAFSSSRVVGLETDPTKPCAAGAATTGALL